MSRRLVLGSMFALCVLVSTPARAHPLAPALLELEEGSVGGTFALRWKTPRADDAVVPALPKTCDATPLVRVDAVAGGFVRAGQLVCGATGLAGATIAVDGLAASGTDALVRIQFADGHTVRALLRPDTPSLLVPARESVIGVFFSHARMGAAHLAAGPDHLLFLVGLVALIAGRAAPGPPRHWAGRRRLVVAVTAFTVGHSVTLALAALGLVRAPALLVEVAIAATLVWLAVELARRAEGDAAARTGVTRWTLVLPFAFGLLHGLGFASALGELGVPVREIPLALGGFNLGIEVAQLALVGALLGLAGLARHVADALVLEPTRRSVRWAALVPAYAIGSLGIYWCLDRVAGAF